MQDDHYIAGIGMRDIGLLATCTVSLITLLLTTIILVWIMMKRDEPLWK